MKGLTVLLLDDDPRTRLQMARPLRKEGCRVIEACDGEDGLAILRGQHVDLVVTDVRMPRLGGFGFFAAVRLGEGGRPPIAPDVPVILVSGFVTAPERARALDAGVDEFLARPFDLDEFLARVRAVVRRFDTHDSPSTRGDLVDVGGASLTQALCHARRTCRIRVRGNSVMAYLDLHEGRIVHAEITTAEETRVGEPAALHALTLESGSFSIEELPADGPRTITRETDGLLLAAAHLADENAASHPEPDPETDSANPEYLELPVREATETVSFQEEVWDVDPAPISSGEFAAVGAPGENEDDRPDDEEDPAFLKPY